jgi:peroxiredoxin
MRISRDLLLVLACLTFTLPVKPALAADKAPSFTLEKVDGGRQKLADFLGQGPVLLNFWASWCKPCKQEAPHLIKLYEELHESGLQVVAISVDDVNSVGKVKTATRKLGLPYPVLLDPRGEYSKRLGVASLPTNVLLDNDGRIVRTFTGFRPGDEKEFAAEIKKLMQVKKSDS